MSSRVYPRRHWRRSDCKDIAHVISSGLRIINIANPAAPTEAGFYDTPGDAVAVAVAGNYAYVADGHGGLLILGETHRLFLPMVTRTM